MSPFEYLVNGAKIRVNATYSATLTEYPINDAPPVASFSAGCTQSTLTCTFDASGSTDDVGIVSYKWDWGNGRGETKSISAVRNTWATSGTSQVTLIVTDTKGQASAVTRTVVVP